MMKLKLYSVRDLKADAFGAPLAIATEGLARRSFLEAAMAKGSELAKYPEDYQLYQVGEWDPESGLVVGVNPAPRFIVSAGHIIAEARAMREVMEPELLPKEVLNHAGR